MNENGRERLPHSALSRDFLAVRKVMDWDCVEVGGDWRLSPRIAALIRDVAGGSVAALSRSAHQTLGSGCCASRWDRSEKGNNYSVMFKEVYKQGVSVPSDHFID